MGRCLAFEDEARRIEEGSCCFELAESVSKFIETRAVKESMNLKEILADPSVSYWLKDALRTAYERDPVAALRDARQLLQLLGQRYTQIVNREFGSASNPWPEVAKIA
jgi:hypothetical protein